jgi:hypothetical protein
MATEKVGADLIDSGDTDRTRATEIELVSAAVGDYLEQVARTVIPSRPTDRQVKEGSSRTAAPAENAPDGEYKIIEELQVKQVALADGGCSTRFHYVAADITIEGNSHDFFMDEIKPILYSSLAFHSSDQPLTQREAIDAIGAKVRKGEITLLPDLSRTLGVNRPYPAEPIEVHSNEGPSGR